MSPIPVPVSGQFPFQRVAIGGRFACGTTKSLGTWCWGSNGAGQVGVDPSVVGEFTTAPTPVSAPLAVTLP